MRHDSVESIYFPVTGALNWPSTATGISVSADNGVTYQAATVDLTTATAVTLPNGKAGTRAWIAVPAVLFTFLAGTQIVFIVKLVNAGETPIMVAAGELNIT